MRQDWVTVRVSAPFLWRLVRYAIYALALSAGVQLLLGVL